MTTESPSPPTGMPGEEALRRRIYVASSWRNEWQPEIVAVLRADGHEVYDFRNPAPGNGGFAWGSIDPDWLNWTPQGYVEKLDHPVAREGFALDKKALDWCDTCVLVLPCGRSAHLEAGYAAGQGKHVIFLLHPDKFEPELMYLLGDGFAFNTESLRAVLALLPSEKGLEAGAELVRRLREAAAYGTGKVYFKNGETVTLWADPPRNALLDEAADYIARSLSPAAGEGGEEAIRAIHRIHNRSWSPADDKDAARQAQEMWNIANEFLQTPNSSPSDSGRDEAIEACALYHDKEADRLRAIPRYERGVMEQMEFHEESAVNLRALKRSTTPTPQAGE